MIVLRLLGFLAITVLLVGCVHPFDNLEALKSDVSAFKAYLNSIPPPNGCEPPGVPQARICYYMLSVKSFDKSKGLYAGHVTKDVVAKSAEDCKSTREAIQKDYPEAKDYKCLDPKNYRYVQYGFKFDGELKDGDHGLVNVPWSNELRIGTPDEANEGNPPER
jgi:hypothetical protein